MPAQCLYTFHGWAYKGADIGCIGVRESPVGAPCPMVAT
jgi:hypothetical protein